MGGVAMNSILKDMNGANAANVTGRESDGPKDMRGQLTDPAAIRKYILGGNATFTLKSLASGKHYTYRVKSAAKDRDKNWSTNNQNRDLYFVKVLAGSDNDEDYVYIGLLSKNDNGYYDFKSTSKSKFKEGSPAFDGFAYCWDPLDGGCRWPSRVEFYHEGSCCMCGRKLTVPESVAAGIGPECASKGE